MYASSANFTAMIDNRELTLAAKVSIVLPGGIYPDVTVALDSLRISASIDTDLPEGMRIQSGVPALTAEFTLSGLVDDTDESKTAAWLFGKYQTTSPLYRTTLLKCAVTVDIGGVPEGANSVPEMFRKFTGQVATCRVKKDGSVAFACVDKRNLLRGSVDVSATPLVPPFNSGLTSEYAVDALLRKATAGTVSSWPAARPSCVFAAGLRTSLQPEVGLFDDETNPVNVSAIGKYSFVPGAFGSALLLDDDESLFWHTGGTPPTTQYTTSHVHIEAWLTDIIANNFIIRVSVGAGSVALWYTAAGDIRVELSNNFVDLPAGTIAAGAHYFAADFTIVSGVSTSTWSATGYIDGTSFAFGGGHTGPTIIAGTTENVAVIGNGTTKIEALQVTTESAPLSNSAFAPAAILDPSLNSLQIVPQITGDPWQAIQQIAAAELAVAGFLEDGTFAYRNRDHVAASSAVRTLTSAEAIEDMSIEESVVGVANHAQVEAIAWTYAGVRSTVWSLSDVVKVPRGQKVTLTATFDQPVASLDTDGFRLPNNSTDTTATYFRASTSAAGVVEATFVFCKVVQTSPTTAIITLTNPSGADVWMVSPANYTDTVTVGTPLLRIAGVLATAGSPLKADAQWPPIEADGSGGAVSSTWGDLLVSITGNGWIQSLESAGALADWIVEDSPVPRPTLTDMAIFPDVRLQLLDRCLISDSDVHSVNEYAVLFGWTLTLQGRRLSMTVDARTVVAPGGFILGVAGRDELNVTTNI